jgi:hypothetical protein
VKDKKCIENTGCGEAQLLPDLDAKELRVV